MSSHFSLQGGKIVPSHRPKCDYAFGLPDSGLLSAAEPFLRPVVFVRRSWHVRAIHDVRGNRHDHSGACHRVQLFLVVE